MDEAAIRDLIKVSYLRSRCERDVFSQFVFRWICLNAWLAFESGKDEDRHMINWLKAAAGTTSRLRSAYDHAHGSDVFLSQLRALTTLCPIESSRPGREPVIIASVDDFPNIVEAIYRVRCNLFHGTKRANDEHDLKLVTVSARILEKWIGNLVRAPAEG